MEDEFEEQSLPLPSSCLPSLRRPLSPFGGFAASPFGTPRTPTTASSRSSSSHLRQMPPPPPTAAGGEGGGREEELGRRKYLIASLVREVSTLGWVCVLVCVCVGVQMVRACVYALRFTGIFHSYCQ